MDPLAENPSDPPSRWFETSSKVGPLPAELDSAEPVLDLRELLHVDDGDMYYFIQFCSGPECSGDLADCIETLTSQHGIKIRALRIDPLAQFHAGTTCRGDLLSTSCGLLLLDLIHNKRVIGGFGSPPRSTVSAARHVPLVGRGGPRPLRSRDQPWDPLQYCTDKEKHAVNIGNALFLICIGLLGEIAFQGGWVGLEHPADRMREPFTSFFHTPEVKLFKQVFGMAYYVSHQCRFGADSTKPTGLLLPFGCGAIQKFCNHRWGHDPLIGRLQDGNCKTTPAARYPKEFCQSISRLFVSRLVEIRKRGYIFPFAPHRTADCSAYEPWSQSVDVRWGWPEPRPAFLTGELEAINSFKIFGGHQSAQQ